MIDRNFWRGKRVFLTGHSGFKGSWLCLLLNKLQAQVTGYALTPPTPSLFELCRLGEQNFMTATFADIRCGLLLLKALTAAQPEIVIHLAAQPLVLKSYQNPLETYETNVMGTVNLLEAVRACAGVKVLVNVTTDKCYQNQEWLWGYRETEPLGGYDPYASSKACAELITASYRQSFLEERGVGVATARAGNVIGGGDWAAGRLVADCMKALLKNETIVIRNPTAVRPWQHVLESLAGYLALAQNLYYDASSYSGAWNFGPEDRDAKPVSWVVEKLCALWGEGAAYKIERDDQLPHEAHYLKLDSSKARANLFWRPKWNLKKSLGKVVEWTRSYQAGQPALEICNQQIEEYLS